MPDLTLGALVDPATGARRPDAVVLPTADLTTHGVIVGMTGSGKTGLGVVLIEECLRAGVPALLIDPKGDLTNLRLMFPDLSPAEFQPWVDPAAAQQAGQTTEQFAADQAAAWTTGLAGWGLGPDQIRAVGAAVDVTIYTPGSTAGVPLNVVGSLSAPKDASDLETVRDEVAGYVSGLLGLVGIDADPLSSREHILLSNLIETTWAAGRDLDLPGLVAQVLTPPIRKLGVLDLDAFFPPADRTALAMRLNGLLASPAFAAWAQGPPLDVGALLHTADGRPRCAIVTTAHLSDQERQFATALLLGKVVTWMRGQSGTTDLRALVYMDEVAGYVPPVAAPPTKAAIMTLMKQARAFGVGMVLATQNPVDVDYKALANAGTWFVGRLQTERDKARLLDGMSAADGGVDTAALGDVITGLGKRQFVLRRAGRDAPDVMTARWAMSYLRGPLTREQIASLTPDDAPAPAAPAAATAPAPGAAPAPPAPPAAGADETAVMPAVADGVPVAVADPAAPWLTTVGADPHGARMAAGAVARVALRYDDAKADLVHDAEYEAVLFPLPAAPDPSAAHAVDYDDRDLREVPPGAGRWVLPDAPVGERAFWTRLERDLAAHLARSQTLEVQANRALKLTSRPGETTEQFTARCAQAAQDAADAETATLRDRYAARVRRLQEQIAQADDRRDVLQAQQRGRQSDELLSVAGSLLGGLLGGRGGTRRIARQVLGQAGRRSGGAGDARRLEAAGDKVGRLEAQLSDLEAELAREVAAIDDAWTAKAGQITTVPIALERSDVQVIRLGLVWLPVA